MVVPIDISGEHVADLFTGPFFFEEPDAGDVASRLGRSCYEEDPCFSAPKQVPVFCEDHVRAMTGFLARLADLIGETALARKLSQEREAGYRLLVEEAPDAIVLYDVESNHVVEANPAAERLFGCGRADLMVTGMDLFHPSGFFSDGETVRRWIQESLTQGSSATRTSFELTVRSAQGLESLCDVSINPLSVSDRRVCQIRYFDVTNRQRHEADLRNATDFTNAILDSIAVEVAVLDGDGTIVSVNEAWSRFASDNALAYGEPVPSTDVGTNYLAVCDTSEGAAAEGAGDASVGIRAVLDGRDSRFSMEYPCHSPSQRRWFNMTVSPLKSSKGAVVIHNDITQRVFIEQREKARNRVLEKLARDEPLNVVLTTLVNSVEQDDPSALCSVLLLDASGERLHVAVAPNLPAFYSDAVEGVAAGANMGSCGCAAYSGETVVVGDIATDPDWIPFRDLARRAGLASCWSEPIKSASGAVLGTFAIYHRTPGCPGEAEVATLRHSATLAAIAIAIERSRSSEQLRLASSVFDYAQEGRPFMPSSLCMAISMPWLENCWTGMSMPIPAIHPKESNCWPV